MGRSGSGKTTVTRLLQMLHTNYEGLIKIDGNDLREIDVDHLRLSLGVVLQDSFLFSGTIREAIAAAKPDARFEDIVLAARLAEAGRVHRASAARLRDPHPGRLDKSFGRSSTSGWR